MQLFPRAPNLKANSTQLNKVAKYVAYMLRALSQILFIGSLWLICIKKIETLSEPLYSRQSARDFCAIMPVARGAFKMWSAFCNRLSVVPTHYKRYYKNIIQLRSSEKTPFQYLAHDWNNYFPFHSCIFNCDECTDFFCYLTFVKTV